MNEEIQEITAIRNSLKYAWMPFFARFGNLTAAQKIAIPRILEGRNVAIASPTASGKTEAVIAPLAELFVNHCWKNLAILYIVPTRALANDTLVRIQGPLKEMGIQTELKHGDKPTLTKIPNCLITTPESLDSLLCRHSNIFSDLSVVVLDEIHILDGTYRGDQLRVLLRRVREVAADKISIHLTSATLSNPEQIARRYVDDFDVLSIEGNRRIDIHYLSSPKEVCELAKINKLWKMLVFCNLRESAERYGEIFGKLWAPYPVVVHHGSLGRQVREEAEAVMKEKTAAICIATSTLEIGIDIGDIDLIVLAEPPFSMSSLIQRIGRGNRRKDTIQVAAITTSEEEKDLLETMFQITTSGILPEIEYEADLSVVIQQIFSLLFQYRGGRKEEDLVALLSDLSDPEDIQVILRLLENKGWVEYRGGRWFGTEKLLDEGVKGKIHSNIPDHQTYSVVDIASGKTIGTIVGVFDRVFLLGQKTWKIVSVTKNTIRAQRFNGKAEAPLFRRTHNSGHYSYLLPPSLRKSFKQP